MLTKTTDEKGQVVKGSTTVHLLGRVVDRAGVRAPNLDAKTRQQRVDAKAFKGRGVLARFLDAKQAVDSLHAEMDALVKLSADVPGRPMYLCAHRRSSTGQVSLRWRKAGNAAEHISWPAVQATVASFSPDMRAWYERVNAEVHGLNQREIDARRALTRAARDMKADQGQLPLR